MSIRRALSVTFVSRVVTVVVTVHCRQLVVYRHRVCRQSGVVNVYVVYRLTRITRVPPVTFTEILVHSDQQYITSENVLLTLRNTRF